MSDNNNTYNKNEEDQGGGSPAWMTTFGDMMTLLLVFFVLLYSFSVMDLDKFQGFISALQNQLGVLDGGRTVTDHPNIDAGTIDDNFARPLENITEIMQEMESYIEQNNLEGMVDIEVKRKGLVISFRGEILYEIAKADLRPEGREVLTRISANLLEIPNDIMVEGHTDNLPINTDEFPSNWELSTARAVNVAKYLIEEKGFDPNRLSAAGYSEYRPISDNDTAEGRAENRRVEIVVLNSSYLAQSGEARDS
ncbi:OmpA family protein [Halanaerobium sp. Z-7514]|uniref:OmpA family protein n=1 Tax=Halanaerobium polyolivorans TaxID=2886943 RepID=A0AAW4X072_9FIRM|nr:OmpA family protein [Halanaerobium polyolivorans]MCC3145198.1 OmpA family protein [Halanaerobium polyolivorans]